MSVAAPAHTDANLEIAIIGMAGRFPRARNLREFWSNIRDGVHCTTFFSDAELREAGIAEELIRDPSYVKAGPVIDGIETFDAEFFGYTPREAETIDPQQRLFLECAWEALENAGYEPGGGTRQIGVYGGVGYNHYRIRNLGIERDPFDTAMGYQSVLGNEKDFLTTRVSYKLGLEGPSIVVQSACSTSLVALHLACQGLLGGECDLALAGGVTLRVPQVAGYLCQEGGIASPDGHCRAFDADAAGCMPGAGVGIVVLKRLPEAVADGDSIRAVIKASSTNNDGALKMGYTAPRVDGQAKAIHTAQLLAQTPAESIAYVETHGTGTPLGDPIEIAGLTQVFRAETDAVGFCAIGSVKTNIGHADAAAGIAGLIKAVLSLEHAEIPPSLDFERPNPRLELERSPFYVNTSLREWPAGPYPRRAGVSSFGLGGANAHVVLEQAPPTPSTDSGRPYQVLPLSARSETALDAATRDLAEHLGEHPDINLADVAHTLQLGRRHWNHRRAVVARDASHAVQALRGDEPRSVRSGSIEGEEPSIAFMFPGQGAQHVNAGRDLYTHEPVFRRHIDHCSRLLEAHLGFDLRTLLYPAIDLENEASERLRQTANTQPALFVLEYAWAMQWRAWGIRPSAMIGHSIGEYVAACLAGVMTLEDALALVAARGRMIQELPGGTMLAIPLTETELRRHLPPGIALAAINGPCSCVASGPDEAVTALEADLKAHGVEGRRLRTSHAFHSAMMDAAVPAFRARVAAIELSAPEIPFVSNVSGTWITDDEATDPDYWAKHLRNCVRFSDGIEVLAAQPGRVLLEVGPGQTLCSLARTRPSESTTLAILESAPRAREEVSDQAFALRTLAALWSTGAPIDWPCLQEGERRRRVPLPSYPFQRRRHWVEPAVDHAPDAGAGPGSLRKRARIADWFYTPSWSRSQSPSLDSSPGAGHRWLLLADRMGLAETVAAYLAAHGAPVVVAARAEQFRRVQADRFELDPRRREHLGTLFEILDAEGAELDRIVYFGDIAPPGSHAPIGRVPFEDLLPDFAGLVALAQALGDRAQWTDMHLLVVTNQVFDVTGDEDILPEKAAVIGPCRVIPQEYPNITCRHIDVCLQKAEDARPGRLIEQLLVELQSSAPHPVVACRGRHRWVPRYEPARFMTGPERPALLREEGVYLITGGLGGIGLALAEHLAKSVRARMILVGRSDFPARDEWHAWPTESAAAKPDERAIAAKIARVRELEALGARVHVARADVAEAEQLREVIGDAKDRFGAIHGVIHAAGIGTDGIIQLTEPGVREEALAAKVRGTRNLQRLLKDEPLDFIVLCSSLRSILGGQGLVDYCAGNAFLDAFAQQSVRAGRPRVISIDWGAWQSVGMSLRTAPAKTARSGEALTLEDGMTPAEGVEAFARILDTVEPQIIVSPQDFPGLVAHYASPSATMAAAQASPEGTPGIPETAAGQALGFPAEEPGNEVESIIMAIWRELLGIQSLSIHDNFFELGGDSLISLQFVAKASRVGLRFTSKQVFEHQTIAELAAVAGAAERIEAEQKPLVGPLPLLPMQHWFFEQDLPHPHHWNLSALVVAREPMDRDLLERAVGELCRHHDALRLRFSNEKDDWRQEYGEDDFSDLLSYFDLSRVPREERRQEMASAAAELQSTLDLSRGPVARVALFDVGRDGPPHVLLVLHHLVADVTSVRVLLEDLDAAYRQLREGEDAIRLPAKSSSVRSWSEHMTALAQTPELEAQLDYWLSAHGADIGSLPVDFEYGENTVGSARSVSVHVGAEESRILQRALPRTDAQVAHALLAAIHQALSAWTGSPCLLVDMEEDGRQVPANGIDISRTVGWFTVLHPLMLTLQEADPPRSQLLAVRDAVHGVPTQGIGHGLLRYLHRDAGVRAKLRALPSPEIVFLYLGRFAGSLPEGSLFAFSGDDGGASRSASAARRHLIEITGSVDPGDGRIRIEWTYSAGLHHRATIESLARRCVAWLEGLSRALDSSKAPTYATDDFPEANLSQEQLDALVARIGEGGPP